VSGVWVFPPTGPYQVQGRDLSEDNFAQEERTSLEILIREVLQNPLDARAPDNTGPVRVRIGVLQPGHFDAGYLARLLPDEYRERLEAAGGERLADSASSTVLVLEDFGTTGLQGNWRDPNVDGPYENWNAFWFREGEGAKAVAGSNGRAGQGKITYYRIGAARAVFGLTRRKSDGAVLLMGRSAFRRVYPYKGTKYLRHSFWCARGDTPLPLTGDDDVKAFHSAFELTRTDEPGLSLVIPFPVDFVPKEAIRTIVAEFYYPIACGALEVSIGGMEIGERNVDAVADQVLPDEVARAKKSAFSKGFRNLVRGVISDDQRGVSPLTLKAGWEKAASLPDDALPAGALATLRAATQKGDPISVRCPVAVRPKSGPPVQSWFDVHIQVPDELDRVEEAYIRRDLLIGSETHLAPTAYLQKARSLTLIKDAPLSAFLADAEEPTHLKWNGSRPRLGEDYSGPQATLRAVRNAAPRLLALISNGMVKRDTRTLAKYFTKPAEEGRRHSAGGVKQGEQVIVKPTPPAPVRKPFRIATDASTVRVLPNGTSGPKADELPMSCVLEVAYEGLDQDPFKSYDPFDFDLADLAAHPIDTKGASVIDREANRVRFEITQPDFSLQVPGFDPHIRMRARLNFTEKDNGPAVGEE
jgi:hypothetical protein